MIEPVINAQTRLGIARIELDDDRAVRQGMFLTADILVRAADVLAVPVTAVGASPDGTTVMRVVDGVVERVPVVTGMRDAGWSRSLKGCRQAIWW